MIHVDIPQVGSFRFEKLALDFNGTLACDGDVLPGVRRALVQVSTLLAVYIITADTYGTVQGQFGSLVKLKILETKNHTEEKASFVESLGAVQTIAIGNGSNDARMLETAALGIAVVQGEGCSALALKHADLCFNHILDALTVLLNPKRLVATLRR